MCVSGVTPQFSPSVLCCTGGGNLSGGGFILIRTANGKNIFLNFREKTPLAATADLFQHPNGNLVPDLSTESYLAVAVPGTVAGLETARTRYGTLFRAALIEPAVRLASNGFMLTQGDVAAIFLNHGRNYQTGDKLIQTQLAQLNLVRRLSACAVMVPAAATV